MPIIGTAGHVDHGKSTLVQALTGRDPDRWAEEKDRGLTIDLGFAWTELAGAQVGFVDVPGHERFIKNMLAGVGAIDVALFVVAADEGWMPQSEEHLAVLDLLQVRAGVIALSRADLADDETLELAKLEIAEQTEDTVLSDWPVVAVSAPTGRGIDQLRAALTQQLDAAGPSRDVGRPRLWVDRSFTIAGAGTVVTGTLIDGGISVGEEMQLWPPGAAVRVRGLQSHEEAVERLDPGARTAINLAGVERGDVARGALLGLPGAFRTTTAAMVDLRAVRGLDEPVTDRGSYHAHIGSGTWTVRLRLLEDGALDERGAALLRLPSGVPLTMGDRLILRDVGKRAVVAGGVVLDPHPADSRKARLLAVLGGLRAALNGTPVERAEALLTTRGVESRSNLACDSGGGAVEGLGTDRTAISSAAAASLTERLVEITAQFHAENPMRPGVPKAELASRAETSAELAELLTGATDRLVDQGATVRAVDFAPRWGADQEEAWQRARASLTDGLAVPRASELGLEDETMHVLIREKKLVRVGSDLVYLPDQLATLQAGLAALPAGFTVAQFRDHFGLTRRQAVPLLEWLDSRGVTTRRGDVRELRRPPPAGDDARPQ